MIKKIIFDLDNTLVFMSPEWENRYKGFIDKYKLNTTPKELYACIGSFEKNVNDVIVTPEMLCKYVNDNIFTNISESAFLEFLDTYKNIPMLNSDEAYDVLNYLSQKYELISYTDWFTEDQIYRLEKQGLGKFFSKIYGWDKVQIKPSKSSIKEIIKDEDIKDYVYIGDSMEFDLEVPNSMGMDTIFVNRKNVEQNKYKEVYKIEDLKNIL